MGITTGSRIGPYEVTSPLGEGGMGIVFRAHDTKLQRDVALKLLPEHFADDADRLARFQREAQTLASLNHPNIAQIYGLEESNNTSCIVMELVEGDTLQERVKRGSIPVAEALTIARQIAEALEAAHERGVVHRDLKPANIKLASNGRVKVLDFGLAKAFQEQQAATLSNSPTLIGASVPGVILGTAAYMSPEQARGKEADRTTDVWAFGCVLYEMLTGYAVFEGETVGEILGGVFKAEPDWRRLPAETPEAIRRLLRRCLQKERSQRLKSADDARLEIEETLSAPAPSPVHVRGSRFAWVLPAVFGLLVVLLSIPAALYLRGRSVETPEMRVDIDTPATPQPLHFALSPDGTRLVFVSSSSGSPQLWLRQLNAATAQPLAGAEGGEYPFWSPDSRSIGFFAGSKLKRLDIGIGPPQELADAPTGRGGTWSSEDTILFAPTNAGPLWRVLASGGSPAQVTKLDLPRQAGHRFPQFLSDRRHFLFFAQGSPDAQGIYLASLDGGDAKRLMPTDTAGAYIDPGLLIFNRQGTLAARRLDLAAGKLTGDTITLAESVSYDTPFSMGGFAVSSGGRVAYRAGGLEARQLQWFDRNGKPLAVAGEPDVNTLESAELSPDSRQVAVSRGNQNNTDVWLIDVLRGGKTRFTVDAAIDEYPIWSPDGTQIAFASNRKGVYDLYLKPSSGARGEQLLLESAQAKFTEDWSRDGRFVLYVEAGAKTGWDLWALPMVGDRKPMAVMNSPFEERSGKFSPDGRWVAYQSNFSGRFEIYVQPFPGPGGKLQVSTAGGTFPRWRADGKELFFIAPNAKLMSVPVGPSHSTFEAGSPVALFQTHIVTGGVAALESQYAVSGDGRFLINTRVDESTPTPITLILNWKPKP